MVNTKDAENLKLKAQQIVKVESSIGSVEIPVEITDTILQGVLSMPHGWGHNREGIQMETAQKHAGVSINDLTDTLNVDKLTSNANFSGTRVRVEVV